MKTTRRIAGLLLLVLGFATVRAQISPGELSAPHAGLEGVGNCTSCHALGKNIDNEKCLACHTDIAERITRRTGFHGSLVSHKCVECHKEHHGREFRIVRFDSTHFDHERAGFTLKGKHTRIGCASCHHPSHLKDERVRSNAARVKSGTFLGLGRECLSCHKDQHGGQFKKACTDCHGQESWKPVTGFAHERTRFPLTGKHQQVECGKCHKAPSTGGTVAYAGVKFATCSSCHPDPHGGKFKKSCESCHTTTGWGAGVASRFDHSTTRFALKGKHATVPCERCHHGRETGVARFVIKQFQRCADCHEDPHRGRFVPAGASRACDQCHVETGWKEGPARTFDHGQTRYPLRDAHRSAKCEKCHGKISLPGTERVITQRQSAYACDDCHTDAHIGQFAAAGGRTACDRCHTERVYLPPAYGTAEHERSRFPLLGSHRAVACVDCHTTVSKGGKKSRQFRWERVPECKDCHKDVHRGQFDKFVRQGCGECHTAQTWTDVRFLHDLTAFALTGKHAGVACSLCHGPAGKHGPLSQWRFAGTPKKCVECHGNNVGRL
jgi:hypothetical protein